MELEAVTIGRDLLSADLTLMPISLEELKLLVQADLNSSKTKIMIGTQMPVSLEILQQWYKVHSYLSANH